MRSLWLNDPRALAYFWGDRIFNVVTKDNPALHAAVVATSAGEILGVARIHHDEYHFDVSEYIWLINVSNDVDQRAVIQALYAESISIMESYGLESIEAVVREDNSEYLNFLHWQGFDEYKRSFAVQLDLSQSNTSFLIDCIEALKVEGFRVGNIGELAHRANRNQALIDLVQRADRLFHPPSLGYRNANMTDRDWLRRLSAICLLPQAVAFAEREGLPCGVVALKPGARPSTLEVDLDMVAWLPDVGDHRGIILRGLLAQGLLYARRHQYELVLAQFSSHCYWLEPVYRSLGFRPVEDPAWVVLKLIHAGRSGDSA